MRGHLVEARERLDGLTSLAGGDPALRAGAFEGLGGVAYWQGDFLAARAAYQAGLDLLRAQGDETGVANALYNLSFSYGFAGDYETGGRLLAEAQEIYEQVADPVGLGKIAWGFGNMYHIGGDLENARSHFKESVDKLRGSHDEFAYGWAVDRLGVVLADIGELDESRRHLTEALDLFTISDDISARTIIFNDFAAAALRAGDFERAVRIAGIVDGLRDLSGANLVDAPRVNELEGLDEALEAVGLDAVAGIRAEGRTMTTHEALAYVRGEG